MIKRNKFCYYLSVESGDWRVKGPQSLTIDPKFQRVLSYRRF